MIKAHYLQHVPFEDPACISVILDEMKIPFKGTHVYKSEPFPGNDDYNLLIIMGGPMGVYDDKQYSWLPAEKKFIEKVVKNGKKIIGICLGAQFLASVLGADVYRNPFKEIGWFRVNRTKTAIKDALIGRMLPDSLSAFHWHGDTFNIPEGAVHLAESEACINQAFVYDGKILGLQFHLESTENSIRNLVQNCGDEIRESPFIQNKQEILDIKHIQGSNTLMKNIISKIVSQYIE